ncbi:MAG: hypothetical protein JNN04_15015 [Cyclobacteriaceae bacterium]|nr:hypothetical protein [Cyclobacteriaceae bacterium]
MKLSEEQVRLIRSRVGSSKISIDTLREDVVDHICCVVEVKLDRGRTFEDALKEAVDELAPDGLDEIQNETLFLLNSDKIILMKKLMYSIGALSSMSFVAGWAFGILHLPGAFELSVYGFLGFSFLFMPLYAMNYYKTRIHRALSEKWKFILGLSSGLLMGASLVFKLLHLSLLPTFFLISASVVFVFGFLPFLFFGLYKKSVS